MGCLRGSQVQKSRREMSHIHGNDNGEEMKYSIFFTFQRLGGEVRTDLCNVR